MDLNEIKVFVRVAQAGSFTRAAKQLGIPNSTASAKVSALERRLGITLLQRTTRKLRLTESGEAYFLQASQGLEEILKAEAEISALQFAPHGLLRVTAPIDLGSSCVAELISAFRKKYPAVNVELIFYVALCRSCRRGRGCCGARGQAARFGPDREKSRSCGLDPDCQPRISQTTRDAVAPERSARSCLSAVHSARDR
jgi:DNA-binding transcriptional LysR family regulator